MQHAIQSLLASLVAVVGIMAATVAHADSGLYLGGSVGVGYVDAGVEDDFEFDENDTAWKIYGGYVWDLPLIDLGVEGGYVDLGSPSTGFGSRTVQLETSGFNLWGVAGVDLGPFGLFGKVGGIAWDIEGSVSDAELPNVSDDGVDIGYGIGAKFMLWSLEFRAEAEFYDIEATDTVQMYSIGANWVF